MKFQSSPQFRNVFLQDPLQGYNLTYPPAWKLRKKYLQFKGR